MALLNTTEIKHPLLGILLEQVDSESVVTTGEIETHIFEGIQPIAYHFISVVVFMMTFNILNTETKRIYRNDRV